MRHLMRLWIIAPALIVALDVVFYYLSDWLHSSHWFTYIDAYGSGFFTWWIDSEQFWGNFELWTAIGVFTGIFGLYAGGKAAGSTWQSHRHAMLVMMAIAIIIAVVELVLGLAGFLFPAPFTIGGMLVNGWYATYFPLHAATVMIFATGAGIYVMKLFAIKQKRKFVPVTRAMAICTLAIALVVLHASIVSTWSIDALKQIDYAITDLAGYLFVVLPIFAMCTGYFEEKTIKQDMAGMPDEELARNRIRNIIIYPIIAAGLAFAFFAWILVTVGFGTTYAITSQFVPKNMVTWIYAAVIATLFYFVGQWKGKEARS